MSLPPTPQKKQQCPLDILGFIPNPKFKRGRGAGGRWFRPGDLQRRRGVHTDQDRAHHCRQDMHQHGYTYRYDYKDNQVHKLHSIKENSIFISITYPCIHVCSYSITHYILYFIGLHPHNMDMVIIYMLRPVYFYYISMYPCVATL